MNSITDRVLAIEQQLLAAERRVEDNVKGAIRERLAAIEERLATVKARAFDDLKREWRHLMLNAALWGAAAVLALMGAAFLVASVWLTLMARFGAIAASLVLGAALLAVSVVPVGILRSVVHRASG